MLVAGCSAATASLLLFSPLLFQSRLIVVNNMNVASVVDDVGNGVVGYGYGVDGDDYDVTSAVKYKNIHFFYFYCVNKQGNIHTHIYEILCNRMAQKNRLKCLYVPELYVSIADKVQNGHMCTHTLNGKGVLASPAWGVFENVRLKNI